MSDTSDFREKVKALGGTYSKWKQSKFCKSNPMWAKGGVCSPLVVKWLEQRSSQQKFKDIMDPDTNYKSTMDVERLKGGQKHIPDYAAKHLQKSGINKPFRTTFTAGTPFECLLHHSTLPDAYFMIGLTTSDGKVSADDVGHAIGIDMINSCFFDPNVGEATFASDTKNRDTIKELFRWWKERTYKAYTGAATVDKFVPS